MSPRRAVLAACLFAATAIAGSTPTLAYIGVPELPPLFEGLGHYSRPIHTSAPLAQRYFNQGLTLAYAFNHDEAIRSFTAATQLDPQCAMAWWGIALCNGPHINYPMMPPDRSAAAWDALQQALAFKDRESAANRALIEALAARYANPPPDDRGPLDRAYAAAMRSVYQRFPDDADVGTLYAESLMDLRPWNLWTDDGQPQPETPAILAALEKVLADAPTNPGAPHLYIHTVEASPDPSKGLLAADRLCDLTPGAGHLIHMPSHIYVLTGRWAAASKQNEKAIIADRAYRALSPRQGFFRLYMIHNAHMLSFASMMQGQFEPALRAARTVVADIPTDYGRENAALVDPYMAIATEVLMRFGRWDDILAEPAPPEYWPITTALWRFARGVALANTGQLAQAQAEREHFAEAANAVPADALMAINQAHDVLAIAELMLDGEIAYNRGDVDTAVARLRAASEREDRLVYMEPPEWIQPTRHALAAILLEAGRVAEAEQVYRADLKKWPENGWSLYGLRQCLLRQGKSAEAARVQERFERVWATADTQIGASCLCVKHKPSK